MVKMSCGKLLSCGLSCCEVDDDLSELDDGSADVETDRQGEGGVDAAEEHRDEEVVEEGSWILC